MWQVEDTVFNNFLDCFKLGICFLQVAPAAYPNNYGNQFHPGYGGFSVVGPNRSAGGQDANLPPSGPNNSQWGPPAPPPAANPTQDEKTKREGKFTFQIR